MLICSTFVLSSCSGSSGPSSADACRTLKLARAKVLDLSLRQLGNQNPENLHEFLPPDEATVSDWNDLITSLSDLADQLGSGEKAELARQFASDAEFQLQVYQRQQNSMEAAQAIADDMGQVNKLCGF